MIFFKLKSQKGTAVFFFTLVMTLSGFVMGMNAARLGLNDLEASYAREISEEAFILSEGCIDNVLYFIRLDPSYGVGVGEFELYFEQGSCTILVEDLGSNTRSITSTVLRNGYEKNITALITLDGNVITLDGWLVQDIEET